MELRLRQICLVAPHLEPHVSTLCTVLGTMVTYVDPAVGKYGLVNALMPLGNAFLEVVAPTKDGTAAGRYLERRGGAGGYMVILECQDIAPWLTHLPEAGVRVANDLDYDGHYRGLQLHPRDTGGTLLEINHTPGGGWEGTYHPAGPRWKGAPGADATETILAAELQSDDPGALAARWSAILRRPISDVAGVPTIALDRGTLRFVTAADGRGEGLGGIDVRLPMHERVRRAARQKDIETVDGALLLCGLRVRLVP
jgi:Glyoxalase-like domain